MHADDNGKLTLDDVLNEVAALPQAPDAHELRAWITRFPQFAKEIIQFVTDWVAMGQSQCRELPTEADVDRVVSRIMSRVEELLDAEESASRTLDLASSSQVATCGECEGSSGTPAPDEAQRNLVEYKHSALLLEMSAGAGKTAAGIRVLLEPLGNPLEPAPPNLTSISLTVPSSEILERDSMGSPSENSEAQRGHVRNAKLLWLDRREGLEIGLGALRREFLDTKLELHSHVCAPSRDRQRNLMLISRSRHESDWPLARFPEALGSHEPVMIRALLSAGRAWSQRLFLSINKLPMALTYAIAFYELHCMPRQLHAGVLWHPLVALNGVDPTLISLQRYAAYSSAKSDTLRDLLALLARLRGNAFAFRAKAKSAVSVNPFGLTISTGNSARLDDPFASRAELNTASELSLDRDCQNRRGEGRIICVNEFDRHHDRNCDGIADCLPARPAAKEFGAMVVTTSSGFTGGKIGPCEPRQDAGWYAHNEVCAVLDAEMLMKWDLWASDPDNRQEYAQYAEIRQQATRRIKMPSGPGRGDLLEDVQADFEEPDLPAGDTGSGIAAAADGGSRKDSSIPVFAVKCLMR
jgi:hypothetical protein